MIHHDDMSSFPMIVVLITAGAGIQDRPLTINEELNSFSPMGGMSHLRLNGEEVKDPITYLRIGQPKKEYLIKEVIVLSRAVETGL